MHRNEMLNEENKKQIFQLNWIGSQTRPDLTKGMLKKSRKN